jgi:GTP cyclohydrolase I
MFARRLQVQERMTQQIADFLQHRLNPYGVRVVIEAEHLCLAMRGVQKSGATMVTSSVLGTFRTTKETRDEFMSHLGSGNSESLSGSALGFAGPRASALVCGPCFVRDWWP